MITRTEIPDEEQLPDYDESDDAYEDEDYAHEEQHEFEMECDDIEEDEENEWIETGGSEDCW